ncbi:hypothetical protein RD792_010166 [Penstemon davidsonii]|uniref:Uncharacterized protein n=1 Tax=Penstemon davidsonii TaxID=160366 RepID=A0ABR0D129_9LAMI|nr:hypothetical protein RD792_010166 [Penstemon davidsonii]
MVNWSCSSAFWMAVLSFEVFKIQNFKTRFLIKNIRSYGIINYDRLEEEACRTISLCTGMQSSTLAGLLATQFLGSTQAVSPACSVVAMAIMGLCLASFWGSGYRIRDLPAIIIPQTLKA